MAVHFSCIPFSGATIDHPWRSDRQLGGWCNWCAGAVTCAPTSHVCPRFSRAGIALCCLPPPLAWPVPRLARPSPDSVHILLPLHAISRDNSRATLARSCLGGAGSDAVPLLLVYLFCIAVLFSAASRCSCSNRTSCPAWCAPTIRRSERCNIFPRQNRAMRSSFSRLFRVALASLCNRRSSNELLDSCSNVLLPMFYCRRVY